MKKKNPLKPERNKPCACGSGVKYKKCCFLTKMIKDKENIILLEKKLAEQRLARAIARQNELDNTGMRRAGVPSAFLVAALLSPSYLSLGYSKGIKK